MFCRATRGVDGESTASAVGEHDARSLRAWSSLRTTGGPLIFSRVRHLLRMPRHHGAQDVDVDGATRLPQAAQLTRERPMALRR